MRLQGVRTRASEANGKRDEGASKMEGDRRAGRARLSVREIEGEQDCTQATFARVRAQQKIVNCVTITQGNTYLVLRGAVEIRQTLHGFCRKSDSQLFFQ